MKVTIFKRIGGEEEGNPWVRNLEFALDRIRNGNSRHIVDQIRYELDDDRRAGLKMQLPCILFSGEFTYRSLAGLKKHSGIICLDFDKFPDEETLNAARETLEGDEYTLACFLSPSGYGLKVLVKIPAVKEDHKGYFDALKTYYDNPYFDKRTSDYSRICYESFDPSLFYNPDSTIWSLCEEVEREELGVENPLLPIGNESVIVENLMKWWTKKYGSNKGSRNSNLFILAAAFNDFGVSDSEARSVLLRFQEKDFPEREIDKVIKSAYKKKESFGTRFFEDYKKKQDIEKLIHNGKTVKEIVGKYPNVPGIKEIAERIHEESLCDEFWTYNDKGKFVLVQHKFKKYLKSKNIFKYFPSQDSKSVFIKIVENRVSITSVDQIKDIVLNDLETREGISMIPFDNMADKTKYFTDAYLNMIDTVNIEIQKDTEDTSFLYYRNKVIKVTKDSVSEIDYIDLDGYVWENQIIDRDFIFVPFTESVFKKFIWLVSGQKDDSNLSLKSSIGYLLSSFKTGANNKAVIFNDEVISDNPNGGSGKGLISNAIGYIKKVVFIDGKQFDFNKSFAYQTVSPDCQVLIFDDVKKNFAFESLFSLITEGITIEKKGQDAKKIPVQNSPKIIINTNYTINGQGGSHERRKHEIELSAYFGAHHSPLEEFGHMLFDHWDESEWSRFDNFMLSCLQIYFNEGLMNGVYSNLPVRKIMSEVTNEFYLWAESGAIPMNTRFNRQNVFEEFLNANPEYKNKKWYDVKRFKASLKVYSSHKGYIYDEGISHIRWSSVSNGGEIVEESTPETPF